MKPDRRLASTVTRFLKAWMGARQMIQGANFNRFQKAGLSATQFMTLNLIPAGEATMTLGELARRLNLSAATVTQTIDSLEARALLSRTQSGLDRRRVLLSLTSSGRALQNAASDEFHGYMAGLFRKLNPQQRAALTEGLEALLLASEETHPRGVAEDGTSQDRTSETRHAENRTTDDRAPRARHGDLPVKRSSQRSPPR